MEWIELRKWGGWAQAAGGGTVEKRGTVGAGWFGSGRDGFRSLEAARFGGAGVCKQEACVWCGSRRCL